MKRLNYLAVVLCAVFAATYLSAKTPPPYRFHKNPELYLKVQSEHLFEVVDEALDAYPPVVGYDLNRRLALTSLDALLHDMRNDNSEAAWDFIDSRMKKFVASLEAPHKRGLRIYKVYNEAVIARTKSVTIAFDIARGRFRGLHDPIIPNEVVAKIVAQSDILFLSHNHRDHVDRFVVEQFLKEGKRVVAPHDILPDMTEILHYRNDDTHEKVVIPLKSGKSLSVTIYPGHQGKLSNNIYVVTTPEKYVVAHSGDQDHRADLEWLAMVKESSPRIDAFLLNAWTRFGLPKIVEGFDARYVFTGHENEMGHSIDHREAFWLTFSKFEPLDCRYVVMAWCESFLIK